MGVNPPVLQVIIWGYLVKVEGYMVKGTLWYSIKGILLVMVLLKVQFFASLVLECVRTSCNCKIA